MDVWRAHDHDTALFEGIRAVSVRDEPPGLAHEQGPRPQIVERRHVPAPAEVSVGGADGHVAYAEGLRIGYRHYDASGIPPAIPFGHGLAYGEFVYGPLTAPDTLAAG